VTSPEHKPWIGGLAGAVGGIAGVFAMTALQLLFDHLHGSPPPRPVRELSQRGGRHDIARLKMRARKWRLPQKDATVRTAERLSYLLRARPIAPHQRHIAGVAVHYAFGALTGGVYGFIGERYPVIGTVSGLPFGAAVWLFAEELALPITVLSDTPDKYPLRDHLNALAAHLVFGSTTEITRRFTRELIVRAMAQRAGHDIHASEKVYMTKQKSPHAQTQQNTKPQQSDFAGDQDSSKSEDQIYARMEGAEAGSDRTPRKPQDGAPARNTEPESSAHEGSVSTRTPRRSVQGITSHSAEEESERQEKVVNDRPDARGR
jgi:hypothetical protein